MRIKLLCGVGLGGGKFAYAGDTPTVDDHFARTLIREGRAVAAPEAPEPTPPSTTPTTRDPKPRRTR